VEEPEDQLRLVELGGIVKERPAPEIPARQIRTLIDQEVNRKLVVLPDRSENGRIGKQEETPNAEKKEEHPEKRKKRRH
jgi:hypothetical protein